MAGLRINERGAEMRGIIWTDTIFKEFVRKAMLSEDEIAILETSIKGWSRVEQSIKLKMSVSRIQRIDKRLKAKYDAAQKESDILPLRKRSKTA